MTNIIEFCRLLHRFGIPVSPDSSLVAVRAVQEIDLTKRLEFRTCLRLCLLKRPEDNALFTQLFNSYWTGAQTEAATRATSARHQTPKPGENNAEQQAEDNMPTTESVRVEMHEEQDADAESRVTDPLGAASRWGMASALASSEIRSADPRELQRIARALTAQLATRRSRRRESHAAGRFLDFRRSMRDSISYGGLPIQLSWKRRQVTRAQLLIFCDVSRSMEAHARMLLEFAAAVLRQAWKVEVFLFASKLTKVTDRWIESDLSSLATPLSDLGGGTEIGMSLQAFLEDYAYCLTGNRSTIIILSDGLDAGEPEQLSRAMARLKSRSQCIIWLNPLLATRAYEPTARGMAAALPFTDVFAPAHDVGSLWQMVRYLKHGIRA
ncbi:MAG: VWA domain-containing protein [Proteobacteria bacterium]|nr:VWA domain-containing protein [Pseudomonadota bacterium]